MAEYIEREALQKEVKRLQGIPFSTPLIVNAIEKAPKVDVVEVKHGEWVKVSAYNDGILNTVKCSICGNFQSIGEWDWQLFCPHCGAKMDKKEGASSDL